MISLWWTPAFEKLHFGDLVDVFRKFRSELNFGIFDANCAYFFRMPLPINPNRPNVTEQIKMAYSRISMDVQPLINTVYEDKNLHKNDFWIQIRLKIQFFSSNFYFKN